MAKTQQKDIFSRVQGLGAETLKKLADVPGGSKLVDMANETRTRLDEVQKRLRGLDELEKRVAKLERELAKKPATARRRTTTARKPAAKQPSAYAGTRTRSAPGATSKRTGVVPGCSPSSSIGSGSSASTDTTAPRSSSAFGCGRCLAR